MARTEYDGYVFPNGWKMAREDGKTPTGNDLNGRWVLRDSLGLWIDCDKYRHDLAERFNLDLLDDDVIQPD